MTAATASPSPSAIDAEMADILAQIEAATPAPEAGALAPRAVLHRGDEDLPTPMVASALRSAGYSFVYDTLTGERSLVNNNLLPQQLRKRREDGSKAFTTRKPDITPFRGSTKCPLHPDRMTDEAKAMGLQPCRKANLVNEFQATLHAQHRHAAAWKALEEARVRRERDEDRAAQRAIIELARAAGTVKGKAA